MIRTYFQMLLEEEMPGAEGKMKQFASWFTHGVPGGAALRKAIYEAKSGAEILGRVEEFFEAKRSPASGDHPYGLSRRPRIATQDRPRNRGRMQSGLRPAGRPRAAVPT